MMTNLTAARAKSNHDTATAPAAEEELVAAPGCVVQFPLHSPPRIWTLPHLTQTISGQIALTTLSPFREINPLKLQRGSNVTQFAHPVQVRILDRLIERRWRRVVVLKGFNFPKRTRVRNNWRLLDSFQIS